MGLDKISADVLARTTQILRSGSDADIRRLRQYLVKFKLQKIDQSEKDGQYFEEVIHLLQVLKESKSSFDALEVLSARHPSKNLLVQISREIGLPVVKSDKLEHLKQKIVHELVESRLNSEAIRNPRSKQ